MAKYGYGTVLYAYFEILPPCLVLRLEKLPRLGTLYHLVNDIYIHICICILLMILLYAILCSFYIINFSIYN